MTVWKDADDGGGGGIRYTILPRDEVEEGAARSTARAVLQEIGDQRRRDEEPDVVTALEEVADRTTGTELMEEFEQLRLRHEDLRRERKRLVQEHNRAVQIADRREREGVITREHREELEDAEQTIEERSAEIDEVNAEIEEIRDRMTEIAKTIDREFQTVRVLPSSPSLDLPDDPRKTAGG